MIVYPCNDQTPMLPLSDEAAVMVLEFLQRFTECFESQYYGEIHRYYAEQSTAHRKAADPPSADDPPF
ncbi:hypothetical protein HF673_10060 [Acidithiobacillus thiooxidans]|jgi:hypothetical protein|uniref:hypothetical protein n=1 Tax=Acidithiobacillus thiooxidans TaxID=930 RepID=UPI001C06875E|nr:hypothetical protein [Acidithiobacillus thiooxidans]MBU2836097.1 hypothetical protein [Acidithiobacillus thiooxidans]